MPPSIRRATPADAASIAALLSEPARRRNAADPALWRLDGDAEARIAGALASQEPAVISLVAEEAGRVRGFARAMLVPVPPIYDPGVTPGMLCDDCYIGDEAPAGAHEALLAATEAALAEAGATSFIASCIAGSAWEHLCAAQGYEVVTLYLGGGEFAERASQRVRAARGEDVPGIVALSAEHRAMLQTINPRFWRTHAEADHRFGLWMGYSLTLADRSMLIAEGEAGLGGYVIAQPCPALHMPLAHDPAGLGLIDDFHTRDFSEISQLANGGATADALLDAAETEFARRGFGAALVVCPADWTSKRTFLETRGYRTEKVWMLKRP